MESISLFALTQRIQFTIKQGLGSPVWVRAEISDIKENYSGHCYLELIEKDKNTDQIIAKLRANIWASTFSKLKPYFEEATGTRLKSGINVLVAVTVDFHGQFGLSLTVRDIDPTFTLGELAARRQQILKQLETDGVIDMNKELSLPLLPKRVAVISSATAAGYEDFCNQILNDENQFAFYLKLFPAIMQGDQAAESIINALEKIYQHAELFDLVLIIRGGGATTDLSCFDSYELALNCAQFPLPVIAGIGHQRDFSIVDRVAFHSVKTPTAAAEFLIDKFKDAEFMAKDPFQEIYELLQELSQREKNRHSEMRWRMRQALQSKTANKKVYIENARTRLRSAIGMKQQKQKAKIQLIAGYKSQLRYQWKMILQKQSQRLAFLEKSIEPHSPKFLVEHGYTLTTFKGKRLTSIHEVTKGDEIRTWLHDGDLISRVE